MKRQLFFRRILPVMQFPAQRTGVFLHFLRLLPKHVILCRLLRLKGKMVIFLRIYQRTVLRQYFHRILPVFQVPVRYGHTLTAIAVVPPDSHLIPVTIIQNKVIITALRNMVKGYCYIKVMLVIHRS